MIEETLWALIQRRATFGSEGLTGDLSSCKERVLDSVGIRAGEWQPFGSDAYFFLKEEKVYNIAIRATISWAQ